VQIDLNLQKSSAYLGMRAFYGINLTI